MRLAGYVMAIAVIAGWSVPAAAGAVVPGENGRIVYTAHWQVKSVNPDGTDRRVIYQGHPGHQIISPTASGDGRRVAWVQFDGGEPGIWVADADGSGVRRVHAQAWVNDMAWSPDGTRFAYVFEGRIRLVDAATGAVTQLTTPGSAARPRWSPDSTRLAYRWSEGEQIGIALIRVADGQITRFTTQQRGQWGDPFEGDDWAEWSPDGERLLVARTTYTLRTVFDDTYYYPTSYRYKLLTPAGAEVGEVDALAGSIYAVAWSPDGRKLVTGSDRLAVLDLATGERTYIDDPQEYQNGWGYGNGIGWAVRTGPVAVDDASATLGAAGGSVTTGSAATEQDPLATTVTSPVAGDVTIAERTTTATEPSGYTLLGQQVQITAPAASASAPLRLAFRIDRSLLSAGADASTLQVFRNGTAVPDCTGPAGTAAPDPCIATRSTSSDGDVELLALTSRASTWTFGQHVPFMFSGLLQPIDRLPTVNTVKAGAAVPVKFSLSGDQGLDVLASGHPRSVPIECSSRTAVDAVEETVAASRSGLTYDAATRQYVYVWKTSTAWSGAPGGPCRELIVKLRDGTVERAQFRFGR